MAPITAISAPGILARDPPRTQHDEDDRDRDGDRVVVDLVRQLLLEVVSMSFPIIAVPPPGKPSMPRNLTDRHLDADAGQEPDQHRAREKVGQEPEADDTGQGEDARRPSARAARPSRPTRGEPGAANPVEPAGQDRGGRRVGADHQVPRRAQQSEQDRWGSGSCTAQ